MDRVFMRGLCLVTACRGRAGVRILVFWQVLETCQEWVREAEADRESSASRMKKFLNDICNELAKL